MKTFIDEKVQKIKKRNNSTNKNLNINNRFFPKDVNRNNFNARLSDSNIEINKDEIMNNDLRCLNCYLIPFLTINTPTHSINLNCNFGHSTKLSVEEYLEKGYENNFSNLSCNKCKTKIFKNEKDFIYCKECSELLCLNCVKKHNNLYDDTHHMVHLDKFDSTCILHNEAYDYFCLDCKKNICQYCFDEFHNEHNLVDLDDINLKRKEVKKVKENYMKEKDNYLNVPKIFNELVDKLRDEINNIVTSLQSELKFKESIINTYENKVDNYNAIMNLKNLEFNLEPFTINSNISIMENITNLFKYLNFSDVKFINKKINLRKSPDRIKEKKKKIIPKSNNSKSVSANKVGEESITNNGNDTQDTNKINNNNIVSILENGNKKRNNNSLKRSSKVYKKNFINRRINNKYFNSIDNTNNSNTNNIIKLNDENEQKNKINEVEALNSQNNENKNIINSDNEEKDKKNLSRITEENSNNQNITNNSNIKETPESENIKKEEFSSPLKREKDKEGKEDKEKEKEKEKEEQNSNLDNTIKVKKEEKSKKFNKSINNRIRFRNNNDFVNNNTNNNSTSNINYVKTEAPNLKMLVKTNKNRFFDKNLDIDNSNIQKQSRDKKELTSQSQKVLNIVTPDPSTMIKQINDNQSQQDNSKTKKIINDNKIVENISKEKKVLKSKKNVNNRAKKKIKEEDKENKKEEEEEEDEEDEEDNEDSNEESDSEKKKEEDNTKKKKGSVKFKTKIKKKSYKKSKTKKIEQEAKNVNDNINKDIHLDENDTNLKTKKINKKAVSSEKTEVNKKIIKKTKNNSKNKEKEKDKEKDKDKEDFIQKKNENKTMSRDPTISEFKPNGSALKIKEADNTICSMLEVRDNIFACGFLLGHIDVYDVNYLNCLLTISEHKSRVTNLVLLKDKSILTSSFDHTMKKIRITNNNSYVVDYVFDTLKNIVYKGIEITNNDIVSISFRGNIDIFKKNENNNNYSTFLSHEIANEEIYNVIELYQNKELAFATDECLRFFSIDAYQNIGNVHLLEFAKGNNLILINKNMLAVLLKHHIGLVNISQRQCISKISLGEIGKTECFCLLKDNTILIGISNNEKDNKNIEFIFKQYAVKINKCKLMSEKLQIFEKKGKEDYSRITSLIELKNGIIAYGTAGFEELRLVGNISIID